MNKYEKSLSEITELEKEVTQGYKGIDELHGSNERFIPRISPIVGFNKFELLADEFINNAYEIGGDEYGDYVYDAIDKLNTIFIYLMFGIVGEKSPEIAYAFIKKFDDWCSSEYKELKR